MKIKLKSVLIISLTFIIFCAVCFFSPIFIRGIFKVETMVAYKEYLPQYANVSSMVIDTADNLFIASDSSDCIIAVSPEGKVLYTIFFTLSDAGGFELVSLRDGSVVVDATGTPRCRISGDGKIKDEPSPDVGKAELYLDYKQEEIYMVGSRSIINSQGTQYRYNGFTLQVVSKSATGKKDVVITNSPWGWLLGFPFPTALWGVIGGSLYGYYKWRKDYESRT